MESYFYMLDYSPYDQVKAQAYPNMLITTGLPRFAGSVLGASKMGCQTPRDSKPTIINYTSAPTWKQATVELLDGLRSTRKPRRSLRLLWIWQGGNSLRFKV